MTKLFDITGKAISGEWGSDDENNTGIPVIRTTNFTNEGNIDYSNVVTRNIKRKNIGKKFLKQGDIIIEKSGGSDDQPVGRVVYFNGPNDRYLFNNFTGLLRIKDTTKWYPRYVFWVLYASYKQGKTKLYQNRTTGLHNLRTDAYVKDLDINFIPLEEQKHISEVLNKVRLQIELKEKELSKLDTLIKARFVEMFGDIKNNKNYNYKPISDLTNVVSGGTPKRDVKEYWDRGTIPWVKTTELKNNKVNSTEEYITKTGLQNSSAKLVPSHTILIAMYGQGKTRGMTAYLEKEAATNQACACILPSSKINSEYLWQYLIMSYEELRNLAKGGNQPNLNSRMIKDFPILDPPIALQNKFVSFIHQVDKSKVVIQKSLDETQTLFDSLMQKYFS